jgi:ABC-type phosphate/phosphonate transport system substrate-binding protein
MQKTYIERSSDQERSFKKGVYMMIKRLSQRLITTALCAGLLVFAGYAEGEEGNIRIAIIPCTDVVMTFKKFHALSTYLQEETGFDIRLVVPSTFSEFERAIKNEEIDFTLQDPHTYLRLADLHNKGALVRVLTPDGGASQHGVVVARRDGNIKKLEDLRGKTVMFGPKLSAARWKAARMLFDKNGINIDRDLRAYSNGGCCEDIAFNVYLRAVDAGVVCAHFLAEHSEKQKELGVDANELTVVSRTEGVPTRVFAARKGINAGIVNRVNKALLRLDKNNPEHRKILYNAEIGGFQKSKDQDYDDIMTI